MQPENSSISAPEAKAFMLSSVVLSAAIFNVAFWYGVFETVFFDQLLYVWVAATVALAASLFIPPVDALPSFMSWRGRVVLLLPTLWLVLETFLPVSNLTGLTEYLFWLLSFAVAVLTLPYVIHVLIMITVPDIDALQTPVLRRALLGFAVAAAMAGVLLGKNHPLFLTCQDFKVAGDDIPANCRR